MTGVSDRLFAEPAVKEPGDLPIYLLGFWRRAPSDQVLTMRLLVENVEVRLASSLSELTMRPDGVAEEQIARA